MLLKKIKDPLQRPNKYKWICAKISEAMDDG